jgi:hypothetical protein
MFASLLPGAATLVMAPEITSIVWGEGVDAVVGVGVAQNKAIISLVCLAEDVGGEVYRLLGDVFYRVLFDLLAELLDVLP